MSVVRDPNCPLCGRPIPPEAPQSVHHLIPKLKGGAKGPTVRLHQICHKTIHAHLTEAQLARDYNTINALKTHSEIAKFIDWVRNKDPFFYTTTRLKGGGRRRR